MVENFESFKNLQYWIRKNSEKKIHTTFSCCSDRLYLMHWAEQCPLGSHACWAARKSPCPGKSVLQWNMDPGIPSSDIGKYLPRLTFDLVSTAGTKRDCKLCRVLWIIQGGIWFLFPLFVLPEVVICRLRQGRTTKFLVKHRSTTRAASQRNEVNTHLKNKRKLRANPNSINSRQILKFNQIYGCFQK